MEWDGHWLLQIRGGRMGAPWSFCRMSGVICHLLYPMVVSWILDPKNCSQKRCLLETQDNPLSFFGILLGYRPSSSKWNISMSTILNDLCKETPCRALCQHKTSAIFSRWDDSLKRNARSIEKKINIFRCWYCSCISWCLSLLLVAKFGQHKCMKVFLSINACHFWRVSKIRVWSC